MYLKEKVLPKMEDLRTLVDSIEGDVDQNAWPVPSYGQLLFGVR